MFRGINITEFYADLDVYNDKALYLDLVKLRYL